VFGAARGVLLSWVLVLVAGLTSLPQQPWWQESSLAAPLSTSVLAARPLLPIEVAKRLKIFIRPAMCGIIGIVATTPVNQMLFDGLITLQHRGQDAAGIVTGAGNALHMHKGKGMVRDVFRTRNMRDPCRETWGLRIRVIQRPGTQRARRNRSPFYVNSPFGIVLAHNGNLTNTDALRAGAVTARLSGISIRTRIPRFCSTYSRSSSSAQSATGRWDRTRSSPRYPVSMSDARVRTQSSR